MTDFWINTSLNRDQLAEALRHNDEQIIYVLISALVGGPVDEAIDYMHAPNDFTNADRDQVVANLRAIADAVEGEDYEEIPF